MTPQEKLEMWQAFTPALLLTAYFIGWVQVWRMRGQIEQERREAEAGEGKAGE